MEPRILIYESRGGDDPPLSQMLPGEGLRVYTCRDRMSLLEEVIRFRPRLVVYGLDAGAPADVSMLELLHRLAPGIPVALVASADTSESRRLARDLRPVYYGVRPLAPDDLEEALRTTLSLPANGDPT